MCRSELDAAKDALRSELRRWRRALAAAPRAAAHDALARALVQRLETAPPCALASYVALPGEADLSAVHAWWWSRGGELWLPRVTGPGGLAWHALHSLDQTTTGAYGIREPNPAKVPAAPLPAEALMLVPGLGFTADGRRLGQGGGFYDRVLATHRGPAIGIGYACQQVDDLPAAAHDIRLPTICLSGIWLSSPP